MHLYEEPTADPAQVRVTAEELAAAVAALEARKAEGLSSTISISEAVQELRLDAAPAEVWAEVQARRADKAVAQAAEEVAPLGRTQAAPSRNRFRSVWSRRRKQLSAVVVALVSVFIGTQVVRAHRPTQIQAASAAYHGPSLDLLDGIPDGVPVYARERDISALAHEESVVHQEGTAIMLVARIKDSYAVVVRSKDSNHKWPLIRHDGKVYLRGYTLSHSHHPVNTERLSLYSAGGVGELLGKRAEYVTIPLKDTHWLDERSADGWEEITLTNVQPDAHFHDR